jgi:hypothetical protein
MHDLYIHAQRWVNGLDKQEWLLMLVAAMVLGFFLLRGFGSRTNY